MGSADYQMQGLDETAFTVRADEGFVLAWLADSSDHKHSCCVYMQPESNVYVG